MPLRLVNDVPVLFWLVDVHRGFDCVETFFVRLKHAFFELAFEDFRGYRLCSVHLKLKLQI